MVSTIPWRSRRRPVTPRGHGRSRRTRISSSPLGTQKRASSARSCSSSSRQPCADAASAARCARARSSARASSLGTVKWCLPRFRAARRFFLLATGRGNRKQTLSGSGCASLTGVPS